MIMIVYVILSLSVTTKEKPFVAQENYMAQEK